MRGRRHAGRGPGRRGARGALRWGLRRAQAAALDLADYDADTGGLTVRSGKGHKARTGYATNGSRQALDAWLAARGPEPGALFCPVNKAGKVQVRGMTDQAIYEVLRKRGHQAGMAVRRRDAKAAFLAAFERGPEFWTRSPVPFGASTVWTPKTVPRPDRGLAGRTMPSNGAGILRAA